MAIDPRMIGSGIQLGRSLAPQGPPIQELLGMEMQQQANIAEFMKSLLEANIKSMNELRKVKMNLWAKNLPDNPEAAEAILKTPIEAFGGDDPMGIKWLYGQGQGQKTSLENTSELSDMSAIPPPNAEMYTEQIPPSQRFGMGARGFLQDYMNIPGPAWAKWHPLYQLPVRTGMAVGRFGAGVGQGWQKGPSTTTKTSTQKQSKSYNPEARAFAGKYK